MSATIRSIPSPVVLASLTAALVRSARGWVYRTRCCTATSATSLGRASSPIVDITGGTNWFYAGVPGYEPGAGLGVLNVANLAAAIARDAR